MSADQSLILHVWPGQWTLPSVDPCCLEAVLFLQLACPGRFSIVETADPDSSPTGQLPFLTHDQVVVSSVPSIISYVSGLDKRFLEDEDRELPPINLHLDAGLPIKCLAQRPAWRSYIETNLGDLLAYSFYFLQPNFPFIHSTYASMLPVPQKYYVPSRIRDSYIPRVQAAGLWSEEGHLAKLSSQILHNSEESSMLKQTFAEAQLRERAAPVFDILTNLVHRKNFLSANRPTTIDVALAARILLIMEAPLPNQTLKDFLLSTHASLVHHTALIREAAFGANAPPLHVIQPPRPNLLHLVKSSVKHFLCSITTDPQLDSENDRRFRRYRWGWYALAATGIIGYYLVVIPTILILNPNLKAQRAIQEKAEEELKEAKDEAQELDEAADEEEEEGESENEDPSESPVEDELPEDKKSHEEED